MATSDVPGAKPANGDTLHEGCWAEHADGSLILVQGLQPEDNRTVFAVFDLVKRLEYRTAMPEDQFKRRFSWKPGADSLGRWTWHDKTPFPWERVMAVFPEGERPFSAGEQITQAQRVAEDLKRRGLEVREQIIESGGAAPTVVALIGDKLARAWNELRR